MEQESLRIVIDIQSVIGRKTGVGKYAESLVKAISDLPSHHQFILFYFNFRSRFKGLNLKAGNFTNRGLKFPGRLFSFLWKKGFNFSFDRLSGKADLFHFPNFISRPVKSGKVVATIHDLSFRRFPEYVEKKNLAYLNYNLPKTLAQADKIIAVSEFTKSELLKFYRINSEKISVIHGGVDETFFNVKDEIKLKEAKERLKLPDTFFLWVGTIEPRKNITGLIEAFTAFRKMREGNCKLVMVGKKGWNYEGFFEKLRSSPFKNEILITEYVSDHDLPFIYNLAQAFVFPSFYEGFGHPPLEAMACGVPVVTTPALEEVVGEAALKIPPGNTKDLAEAMVSILENKILREDLIQKGFERAKKFSWNRTAEKTLSLYEEVLKGEK